MADEMPALSEVAYADPSCVWRSSLLCQTDRLESDLPLWSHLPAFPFPSTSMISRIVLNTDILKHLHAD